MVAQGIVVPRCNGQQVSVSCLHRTMELSCEFKQRVRLYVPFFCCCRYRGFASAIDGYLPPSMTWSERQCWSHALRQGQWQMFEAWATSISSDVLRSAAS